MSESRLIRYTSPPTKYDQSPFGSLCSVLKNDDGTELELYVQINIDQADPHWIAAADLLIKINKEKLKDPEFVQELIKAYIPTE